MKTKRCYYRDGEEITRYTFFNYLKTNVIRNWCENGRDWLCFEDYYEYIKSEIRGGSVYNYEHIFWSEVI